MKKLNWKPVISSFLQTMKDNQYKLLRVYDDETGVEEPDSLERAVDLICAVEESVVVFGTKEKSSIRVYIVLGNSPSEMVSDYAVPFDEDAADKLHKVMSDWSDSWEGKECPTEDDDPHELLNTIADIAYNAPEVNTSNYNHNEVWALNEAMIQIYNLVKKYH